MKFKKVISGLLSLAMVATSVFVSDVTTVKADEVSLPNPVATYDFNGDGSGSAAGTTARVKGLSAYNGNVTFGTGLTGAANDKAVKLGSYGLELTEKNVGTAYTVSVWVKPDGTIENNSPVLALGYHDPENWVAIAGEGGANKCKVWTHNYNGSSPYRWTALTTTMEVSKGEWAMLTLSQSGNDLSIYKNGKLVTKGSATDAMNGANASILLGVNYWDAIFAGLVDEVNVFDSALSAEQVAALYEEAGGDAIILADSLNVTSEIKAFEGAKRTIDVSYASIVDEDDVQVTYESADESVATVDADGNVSGVTAGETTVKTTVTCGKISKEFTTKVVVTATEGWVEGVVAEYDMSSIVNGQLIDGSGRNNHATIKDTSKASIEEGALKLSGTYVELPLSIMDTLTDQESFTIEATFAKNSSCGTNAWLYCLGSISQSSGKNYLFVSPNYSKDAVLRSGIKSSSSEYLFNTAYTVTNGENNTVTTVFDKGVVKLYWNGILIHGNGGLQINSGFSIMDDVVTPGTQNGVLGFIGKSCWSGDGNYQGNVSSFKIYDGALSDEAIQLNHGYEERMDDNLDLIKEADILGSNTALNNVVYNMDLTTAVNEIDVEWSSDHPELISASGVVKNPAADTEVKLTATLVSGALKTSKDFTVTVKGLNKETLNTAIASAEEAIAFKYVTEETKAAVLEEIEKANAATSQLEVDRAVGKVNKAVAALDLVDVYKDPFTLIDDSKLVPSASVKVGGTATVFTLPEELKDTATISYTSANKDIATVDANGVVTGVKAGYASVIATVTANYDGFAMEYQTLVKVGVPAEDVKLVKAAVANTTIVKGDTTQITLSNLPDGATVKYRAKGAAAVTTTGKVTGKKAGTGTIYVTITVADKVITRKVTVAVGDITGKSTVKVNKNLKLKVEGISGTVKWSVSGKKASIKNGTLKVKKAGKVTVTATVGGYTMTKKITVKKK